MAKPAHQIAFAALILWLLGNWIGLHGHFCFDGKEPPVSVHVNLEAHGPHDHHPDEKHMDADVDLSQLAIAKVSKIDPILLLIAVVTLLFQYSSLRLFASHHERLVATSPAFLRPRLRAPPIPCLM